MTGEGTGAAGDGGAPPAFAVDGMLFKLGKYLRILGHDAVWSEEVGAAELLRRARAEGRLFLTRNRRLARGAAAAGDVLLVEGDDPVDQLAEVVERLGLDPRERLFSRCIRCNVELEELAELGPLADRVPRGVRERHRRFWRCPRCATVFWRGTHVANTLRKLGIAPDPGDA